jgi:hypothetical protein
MPVFVVVPDRPVIKVFVSPDPPVPNNHFDSDIVVGETRHPLTAKALNYKSPMVQAIAVHDYAVAEEYTHPVTRQKIGVKIMIPKVIVGDKGKQLHAQAEIDIHRQAAVVP